MAAKVIERHEERGLLQDILSSTKAELVAVNRRRRVGKTFIRNHYSNSIMQKIGCQKGELRVAFILSTFF